MKDVSSLYQAIFFINFATVVITVPVDERVQTQHANSASSSKNAQNLQSIIEGINLNPIIETVVKTVPKMIPQKEFSSNTNSDKNELRKQSTIIAENISQNIRNMVKSTFEKENIENFIKSTDPKLITSSGHQQEPNIFEKLLEVIIDSVKYATTVAISKLGDITSKGLIQTVSETVTLKSRDLDTNTQTTQNEHEISANFQNKLFTENEEVIMETRGIGDYFPGFKSDHRRPWYNGFYHDYGQQRNPYYAGPLGFIWTFFEGIFLILQDLWIYLTRGPRPIGFGLSQRRRW